MGSNMRAVAGAVLGVVVTSLVVVSVPGPAAGVVCDFTWSGADDDVFTNPNNWNEMGVPAVGEVACIAKADQAVIPVGTVVDIAQLEMSNGAMLSLGQNSGLFINGSVQSVWDSSTSVTATAGQIGGSGIIRLRGNATFGSATSAATLTSQDVANGIQPPADTGEMVVEGHATVANLGAAIRTGFLVTVANGGSLTVAPGSYLSADDGTALTILAGSMLDLTGDGGYYRGSDVSGLTRSVLTNNGTLRKSGGTGASVIDAKIVTNGGQVVVGSGTLALSDGQPLSGVVSPGSTLATGRCATPVTEVCQPSTDPAVDPMSVRFTVPGTNAAAASVQIEELAGTADAKQVGNAVLAHADNLVPDTAHPARITLRYSQPDVMATPLGEVQVVHTTDGGQDVLLPDCAIGILPAGLDSCIVRPATRDSQNTYVTVLTVTTSRWHLRRDPPIENQGAPGAPQGFSVKEGAPFDGSVLKLAWSAPASSGAGPVSGYRVYVDGKLRTTTTGTSVKVKNLGAGKHTFAVAAVNAAGQGAKASTTKKLAELSKPRKVDERAGAAGGDRTAGVVWKPPAEAGGLTIKGYQVAVFTKSGKKIVKKLVSASKRKVFFTLRPGEYRFKVRARNADGFGPWSKPTDLVRPR